MNKHLPTDTINQEAVPLARPQPRAKLFAKVRKSRKSLRMLGYVALILLLLQVPIRYWITWDDVHHYRLEYNLFKDDPRLLDTSLDKLADHIKKQKLQNYLIVLGDSVTYGTPESSDHTIGYYLEERILKDKGELQAVFNLSMPAMQAGDLYTVLLMLDERNISRENIVINVRYSSFVERTPGPPIVFWLGPELQQLDPTTYEQIRSHMAQNGRVEERNLTALFTQNILDPITNAIPYFNHKDFIEHKFKITTQTLLTGSRPSDALGDIRPWHMKENLREVLKAKEYVDGFNPKTFDMSDKNLHVYFMNKIIEHQRDTQTLIFLSGTNDELSKEYIQHEGYQSNLKLIDDYFAKQPVDYLNLHGVIDPNLFTDHTHFTKEGYEQIANLLWDEIKSKTVTK
jgi:hypothetical protein